MENMIKFGEHVAAWMKYIVNHLHNSMGMEIDTIKRAANVPELDGSYNV
jgi:hypothetical protein